MRFSYKYKYLVIIILLISGYFFLFFSTALKNQSFCIFKTITGIPCPSCGSTRATLLLFHGEFGKSIFLNPFGIVTNILILLSIAWMLMDIIKSRDTFLPFLKKTWDFRIQLIIFLILVANWFWNIAKGL
jgi:hypothetical protein